MAVAYDWTDIEKRNSKKLNYEYFVRLGGSVPSEPSFFVGKSLNLAKSCLKKVEVNIS